MSDEPEIMPLGIPMELTTTVPYRASIVSPVEGMETGRFEMIEVMGEEVGLTGRDFSESCTSDAVGLTTIQYEIHAEDYSEVFEAFFGSVSAIPRSMTFDDVRVAPDGARIHFKTP